MIDVEDEMFRDYASPYVDRQSASVIQIDNGKTVNAVAVCAAFSALGLGLAVFAAYTARDAAMESRLLQQHVMTLEAEINARK